MLSNTSKYAVRAVLYLAVNAEKNKKIGIKQIAEELDIPTPFLGKILQSLAKHKLLTSSKGPNGGFALAREPFKIKLLDIIEVIDGKDIFYTCMLNHKNCSDEDKVCPAHTRYSTLRNEFYDLFRKTSLSTVITDMKHDISNIIL